MTANADLLGMVDSIQESARLLGQVQARKEAGNYTPEDARFESAMYQAIAADKARIELSVAQGQGFVCEIDSVGERYGNHFTHTNAILRVYNGYVPQRGDKFVLAAAPAQPDGVSK